MVSPFEIPPQPPLQPPLQCRPNHGRAGQQKQQPPANSKLPATIIDCQRLRTMRWIPLSRIARKGVPIGSLEWAYDMGWPNSLAGENPRHNHA
jgi:hypothetical protein